MIDPLLRDAPKTPRGFGAGASPSVGRVIPRPSALRIRYKLRRSPASLSGDGGFRRPLFRAGGRCPHLARWRDVRRTLALSEALVLSLSNDERPHLFDVRVSRHEPLMEEPMNTDRPVDIEPAGAVEDGHGPAVADAAPAVPSIVLHRAWIRKRGQGDPVVMVHGFGGDHNSWRVLAAAAALPRPILAIDLPGHGRSPGGAATFESLVASVAAAIADEGLTTADIVGHSLGAAVAVGVAETARFKVRSLFLLAPAGLGPDINGDFLAGFCRARSEATLAPWMALLAADPTSIPPVFIQVTAETRAQPGVIEAQDQIVRGVFPDGTQVFSVRKALDTLDMPIRVIFGAADRIIPARHMAGLPGTIAQHLFAGVGHMPHIEMRDAIARLLVEHLRAVG